MEKINKIVKGLYKAGYTEEKIIEYVCGELGYEELTIRTYGDNIEVLSFEVGGG